MLTIRQGDALMKLRELPDESVQCCVTSPPFWGLRDYGMEGQLGLEKTPDLYVAKLVEVFREVRRVLRRDGTLWLNLGDSYASGKQGNDSFGDSNSTLNNGGRNTKTGEKMPSVQRKPPPGFKAKDLVGIPWMVAFALRADGWWLRSDIIWAKPNPMPESVTDRPTKSHEYIFLLTKSARYFYDAGAIAEKALPPFGSPFSSGVQTKATANGFTTNGTGKTTLGTNYNPESRNKRSVWRVATAPYPEAHFATYPPDLIKPCILAGSKPGDLVLDPFAGSGTTGQVARELGRRAILIELNAKYLPLIEQRTNVTAGLALTWGAGTNPAHKIE